MRSRITDSRPLRDLVRTYRVGFTIQSCDVDIRGRVVQLTFHLELSGYHDGRCDEAFCLSCNHVRRVLFEVADAVRPIARDAFKQIGYGDEKRVRYASGRGHHREMTLGLELTIRRRFSRASGGWGWRSVERIRAALTGLGCENRAAEELRDCQICLDPVTTEGPEHAQASVPINTLNSESLLTV